MLPAVALVGRPNVGKSTLFNQLTESRDALVADYPGLTRDRRYGFGNFEGQPFIVIDTGGLGDSTGELESLAAEQAQVAMEEADSVIFVVNHREGLTAADQDIADQLRSSNKLVTIAVNKSEGLASELAEAEFYALGLGSPIGIAALHGRRLADLMREVLVPFEVNKESIGPDSDSKGSDKPHLAVIGRPNVGKSTFINRLLGTDRMVTSSQPGTTRDSVLVPCERGGREFVLVDTAGIRRRAKVNDSIEKFSIVQSLKAIENSGVAMFLIDAREGVTEQDLSLIGLIIERGCALTIGINKWDGVATSHRRQVEAEVDRKLEFADFARVNYISALHGSGIDKVINSALTTYEAAGKEFPTPWLNKILERALIVHPPPLVGGRRIRLRYAHQGGRHPPILVIHGNRTERLPAHYRRYLVNTFRKKLHLEGVPLRLELKSGDNPYSGRRNKLTRRQSKHRRRVIRHRR